MFVLKSLYPRKRQWDAEVYIMGPAWYHVFNNIQRSVIPFKPIESFRI